jgi:hypothetical protein
MVTEVLGNLFDVDPVRQSDAGEVVTKRVQPGRPVGPEPPVSTAVSRITFPSDYVTAFVHLSLGNATVASSARKHRPSSDRQAGPRRDRQTLKLAISTRD